MQVGIVGLPNVGKTTLFKALTKAEAEVAPYPFTTTSFNLGVAEVPDERLSKIAQITQAKRIIPTTIKFLDVAGLVKGASKGEGLGNEFLSYIRETAALLHIVRCFEEKQVSSASGSISPQEDIETVNLELILADLSTLQKLLEKALKKAKTQGTSAQKELAFLKKLEENLSEERPLRSLNLTDEEQKIVSNLNFLTAKPLIYIANVSEDGLSGENPKENLYLKEVTAVAEAEKTVPLSLCAKLEQELSELEAEEAKLFLAEMGLEEPGLKKLVKLSYQLLNLITFFTTESQIAQAWTIKEGTKASQAAGKIHSDMEKGFIKAEVVPYEDLVKAGSFQVVREQGHLLIEGKEYIVQDGDVIHFKFNP